MDEIVPPPLAKDDDDNEDLFTSAYETVPKPVPAERKKSRDIMVAEEPIDRRLSAKMDAVDLDDDDSSPLSQANQQSNNTFTPTPLTLNDKEENGTSSSSGGATLDASCVTSNLPTSIDQDNDKVENRSQLDEGHLPIIKVGNPQKKGDGMGAYVIYEITTEGPKCYFYSEKLSDYSQVTFTVFRRFSDFLGLRDKLAEKYLTCGFIVPPAPSKDAFGTAKRMMQKDEFSKEFLEKRAASLERFLNRIAQHPTLCNDAHFKEYLMLESDLPRSKSTSAFSSAVFVRMYNKVGKTVNKITFRMDESEPWFEEKQYQIECLDTQLRKLHASVEALIHHRKELTNATGIFAKSVAMLGHQEEHTALSCALSKLAETEEKIEQLSNQQVNNDFYNLSELLHDHIELIGVVKEVFEQRSRVYQNWQNAEHTLGKKKDAKTRLELSGKTDKISAALKELIEWEAKVLSGQKEFQTISKNIKKEVEDFENKRFHDFKTNIIKYLESLLGTGEKMIKQWEAFLPAAREISPTA